MSISTSGPIQVGQTADSLGDAVSTNVTEINGQTVNFGRLFNVNDFLVGYGDNDLGQTNSLQVTNVTSANGFWEKTETLTNLGSGEEILFDINNSWIYTPTSGFTGADTVIYTITDSDGNSIEVETTVNVKDADQFDALFENPQGQLSYFGVGFADIDADRFGEVIPELAIQGYNENGFFTPNGLVDVDGQELSVTGMSALNGTFETRLKEQFDPITFEVTEVEYTAYVPNEGFFGVDQITVTYADPDGNETTYTKSLEVVETNQNIEISNDLAQGSFDFQTARGGYFSREILNEVGETVDIGSQNFYIFNGENGAVPPILEGWVSGDAVSFTGADLLSAYSTVDGSPVSLAGGITYGYFDSETQQSVSGELAYDAATDTYSIPETIQTTALNLSYRVDDGSGVLRDEGMAFTYDAAPVVEKGVEGEDFLYFSKLAEIRDNDRLVKRGEDSITGNYWVNSRDSSTNDNFVDGGEYATIIGRRGELTADLTADEIIGGLESGDFVASRSYTSYGGYVVSSAFEDGAIDALVQSTGGATNQLTISRIDAYTGELVTGFGGDFRNVSGTELFSNFAPEKTLSGRNDNAFGDVLEQQSQTGGF